MPLSTLMMISMEGRPIGTAQALRAKTNLAVVTKRPRPRSHRRRCPSYSSDSEDGPCIQSGATAENGRLNEESGGGDEDGPLSSKETTQPSDAINASKKRPCPSPCPSPPISGTRLGSKENPIDVDSVASLFEPVVTREYV